MSSTGELYGRSRSHVVVERVAVAVMERNPHASVEVVVWMRDRDGPRNDQEVPGLLCNLGVVPGRGVWEVSILRAATIGISRVARQLVPLVIGTCSSQSRGWGYQDPMASSPARKAAQGHHGVAEAHRNGGVGRRVIRSRRMNKVAITLYSVARDRKSMYICPVCVWPVSLCVSLSKEVNFHARWCHTPADAPSTNKQTTTKPRHSQYALTLLP